MMMVTYDTYVKSIYANIGFKISLLTFTIQPPDSKLVEKVER